MGTPLPSSIEAFVATQFDYIIIGGGTAGLVVAARLSENPSLQVGILEAGFLHQNDALIDEPHNIAKNNWNPKYDWMSSTSRQSKVGRPFQIVRGKLVGGSSALNYAVWDRGSREEYDNWKGLSDENGWDWESFRPFLTKVEDASMAVGGQNEARGRKAPADDTLADSSLGVGGPVKLSRNSLYTDPVPAYIKAWNELGQPTNLDPFGGDHRGVYDCPRTIDPESGKRITATSAYYSPASSRTNLKLLVGAEVMRTSQVDIIYADNRAQVTKILFKPEMVDGRRVACGVEFAVDGKAYSASASMEIIISAGAIQTPQILELSGIGDAGRLEGMNIQTLVDLPGVGENLIDHTFTHIQYQAKHGVLTFDKFRIDPKFAEVEKETYEKSRTGWMAATDSTTTFTSLREITEEPVFQAKIEAMTLATTKGAPNRLAAEQFSIQLDGLEKGNVPQMEFILFSRGLINVEEEESYFVLSSGLQSPFSRGTVHIQSKDPFEQPFIDPCYLTHDFDLFAHLAGYRAIEKLAQTAPLAAIIVKHPPPRSDDKVIQYICASLASGYHYMGTAAMARRDIGGVVGSDLKVHGTTNLRVADASIIPMPIATHIQSTVYAIGEKAANLIQTEYAKANASSI
ncbi:alcohol oxidase [Mycena belliarum]|uniref:Alcohol oxidase n=1 Tax=Mycena belliarum TaxID=1033014 RepID=A0AAD6TZK2_9AGAR|nr:alcohol oxidase [Mycena belliae]